VHLPFMSGRKGGPGKTTFGQLLACCCPEGHPFCPAPDNLRKKRVPRPSAPQAPVGIPHQRNKRVRRKP
jgi:hypothetical protein